MRGLVGKISYNFEAFILIKLSILKHTFGSQTSHLHLPWNFKEINFNAQNLVLTSGVSV